MLHQWVIYTFPQWALEMNKCRKFVYSVQFCFSRAYNGGWENICWLNTWTFGKFFKLSKRTSNGLVFPSSFYLPRPDTQLENAIFTFMNWFFGPFLFLLCFSRMDLTVFRVGYSLIYDIDIRSEANKICNLLLNLISTPWTL